MDVEIDLDDPQKIKMLSEKKAEFECLFNCPQFNLLPPGIQAKKINAWIKRSGLDELRIENEFNFPNRISIPSLKEIWNVWNDCPTFAVELGGCSLLEEIHFATNWTPIALPDDIGKLANLRAIYLNRSKKLPESLALCTKLEYLTLRMIESTTFPSPIKELTQLKQLCVGDHLESIPDWIQNFTQLETLNLGGKIISVSESTIRYMAGIENCTWDRKS